MSVSRIAILVVAIIALILLPLALRRILQAAARAALRVRPGNEPPPDLRNRVLLRYEPHHFHAWMFAWFKTRLDPMFDEFPQFLGPLTNIRTFLDLGCGFGIAGAFLLEWFENATVYAIEPNLQRVQAAAKVFGDRGRVFQGSAPDFEFPELPAHFDAVFFLDVLHFLTDAELDLTLARIRRRLLDGDYLFIRAPMKATGLGSLAWNVDRIHRIFTRSFTRYRTAGQLQDRIENAGFQIVRSQPSGNNPELHWFISTVSAEKKVERLVLEPVPSVGQNGK